MKWIEIGEKNREKKNWKSIVKWIEDRWIIKTAVLFDTIKIPILMLNSGAEVDSMPWTIASALRFGKDFESPLKVISIETGSDARSLRTIQVVTFMQANLFHIVLAVCFILFNSFSFWFSLLPPSVYCIRLKTIQPGKL